jgi:hypothetical protein
MVDILANFGFLGVGCTSIVIAIDGAVMNGAKELVGM